MLRVECRSSVEDLCEKPYGSLFPSMFCVCIDSPPLPPLPPFWEGFAVSELFELAVASQQNNCRVVGRILHAKVIHSQ